MSRLLDPKVLMAIKNLSLAAKTTIDGFMEGINRNTLKGPGIEFSQYRSYQPGDDLRSLDWKMFARSDRYYIRESEVETTIAVSFLVDASNSMNHEDDGHAKIEYARYLAASLAYLSGMQGDRIGLYVLKNGGIFTMAPKRDPQHFSRLFHQLEQITPAGQFTDPVHYRNLFATAHKKQLLILITDFYEQNSEIFALLDQLATYRHEIIAFHVMGRNEMELDYKGYSILEDLETGETINIGSGGSQKDYQQLLQDHLSQVRTRLLSKNIFYSMLRMDEPLNKALRDFLQQRNRLRG